MKVVNRLKTKRNESILNEKEAENLGLLAFGFIAGEPEYFSRFAGITGIDIADVAEIAGSKEFLTAVLNFLLSDQSLLLSFCQNNTIQPHEVDKSHQILCGNHDIF